ncbi:MAG: hypothetical protein R3Y36_00515 [Spirochaetales bacterium]
MMLTVLFSSFCMLFAQQTTVTKPNLYFYGAVSSSGDESTIKLTQDLFFSQLVTSDLFTVQDRSDVAFSNDILANHKNTGDFLFYAEIYEENGKWISVLHLIDPATGREAKTENTYDGYYQILIQAKEAFNTLFALFNSPSGTSAYEEIVPAQQTQPIDITGLFGTWTGEDYIDKIVILRGGRGFIMFENGATMNITVSVEDETFIARQESKPNASFFPDLPREAALVKAVDADPIVWELNIENENSLSGIKHTYISQYNLNGDFSVIPGTVPVKWSR